MLAEISLLEAAALGSGDSAPSGRQPHDGAVEGPASGPSAIVDDVDIKEGDDPFVSSNVSGRHIDWIVWKCFNAMNERALKWTFFEQILNAITGVVNR